MFGVARSAAERTKRARASVSGRRTCEREEMSNVYAALVRHSVRRVAVTRQLPNTYLRYVHFARVSSRRKRARAPSTTSFCHEIFRNRNRNSRTTRQTRFRIVNVEYCSFLGTDPLRAQERRWDERADRETSSRLPRCRRPRSSLAAFRRVAAAGRCPAVRRAVHRVGPSVRTRQPLLLSRCLRPYHAEVLGSAR